MSDRVTDIDQKMLVVSERLNLMLDKQEQLMELQNKYRFSMIINKTITIVIKQIVVCVLSTQVKIL